MCVLCVEELEANIMESKRSEELLKLQETLCWPTLAQLHPGSYIPEVRGYRGQGSHSGSERLIVSKGSRVTRD